MNNNILTLDYDQMSEACLIYARNKLNFALDSAACSVELKHKPFGGTTMVLKAIAKDDLADTLDNINDEDVYAIGLNGEEMPMSDVRKKILDMLKDDEATDNSTDGTVSVKHKDIMEHKQFLQALLALKTLEDVLETKD